MTQCVLVVMPLLFVARLFFHKLTRHTDVIVMLGHKSRSPRKKKVALHWDMRLFTDFCPDEEVYIREGAEGRVFSVCHRLDGMRYAIKQVILRHKNVPQVLHECRVLAGMRDPHIVRYYNCWLGPHISPLAREAKKRATAPASGGVATDSLAEYAGEALTVTEPHTEARVPLCLNVQMEFCPKNLAERLRGGDWPPFQQRLTWASQLCAGLGSVHRRGLCHGDLKAANLLLTEAGALRIADFGMTQVPSYGTAPYTAPEQAASGMPSPEADMHAVGVILLELLHRFSTRMERSLRIAAAKEDPSGQPPLVARCLHRDPAERPLSEDFARYLEEAMTTAAGADHEAQS